MRFSIIIPVRNAQNTIKSCLDAVFSSLFRDFEVIIVDDKSSDSSAEIVRGYPCRVILLEKNKGTAFSRNAGRNNAQGEILVFIDADVTVKPNTLNIIDESFKQDKEIVAVTGLLSKECPHSDFFSQYKNLYMNYIFRQCPKYIDFLYGSIIAISNRYFLSFNETFRLTDDTELGQRYKELNKKILLNHRLEVAHLKRYNFKNIIQNDYFVPFWWAKSFLLHKGLRGLFKKKRFAHARTKQIFSILVSYLLLINLFCFFWVKVDILTPLCLLLFFLALNLNFLIFLYKEKGLPFVFNSMLFLYLDLLVMGLGVILGLIYFSGKRIFHGVGKYKALS